MGRRREARRLSWPRGALPPPVPGRCDIGEDGILGKTIPPSHRSVQRHPSLCGSAAEPSRPQGSLVRADDRELFSTMRGDDFTDAAVTGSAAASGAAMRLDLGDRPQTERGDAFLHLRLPHLEAVADDAVRFDGERGDGHGPNALETQSQHADSKEAKVHRQAPPTRAAGLVPVQPGGAPVRTHWTRQARQIANLGPLRLILNKITDFWLATAHEARQMGASRLPLPPRRGARERGERRAPL